MEYILSQEELDDLRKHTEMQQQIDVLKEALEFYADFNEGMWEACEDDKEQGLFRQYITGTCHPREIARRALAKAV